MTGDRFGRARRKLSGGSIRIRAQVHGSARRRMRNPICAPCRSSPTGWMRCSTTSCGGRDLTEGTARGGDDHITLTDEGRDLRLANSTLQFAGDFLTVKAARPCDAARIPLSAAILR
ncbi:MAG: hypothetical protein AB7S99_15905 [Pseudodonghicola sp.]